MQPAFSLNYNGRKGCKTVNEIVMKKFLKLVLCLAFLASGTYAVDAQNLGNLIKRGEAAVKKGKKTAKEGKEAVEKLDSKKSRKEKESLETVNPNSSESNAGKSVTSSGIVISNPVSSFIEIEPIGLYGVSKSENFGDAYLVLKVKNLVPKDVTNFGSSIQNKKMIAVDTNGKVYNIDSSGSYSFDTPEGIMVKIILNEPGLMFTDIRKDIEMMQQVKFGVISDAQHQGNVTLENVPIFWDEVPE